MQYHFDSIFPCACKIVYVGILFCIIWTLLAWNSFVISQPRWAEITSQTHTHTCSMLHSNVTMVLIKPEILLFWIDITTFMLNKILDYIKSINEHYLHSYRIIQFYFPECWPTITIVLSSCCSSILHNVNDNTSQYLPNHTIIVPFQCVIRVFNRTHFECL